MSVSMNSFLLGIILGLVIGLIAYLAGALTIRGAFSAAIVGALTYGFGGLAAALLLILFFVSSSALTRYKRSQKESVHLEFTKGGQRDVGQVVANSGVAVLCLSLYAWMDYPPALMGYVAAIAVATADTWATEIGVLSRTPPRSIYNGKPVPKGTSGGLTLLGTGASFLGSALIALLGILVLPGWRTALLGCVGGFLGALFDSLLGATWQVMYRCPKCTSSTERYLLHPCGTETLYERGFRWMNNDVVNFLATGFGAGISMLLGTIWY